MLLSLSEISMEVRVLLSLESDEEQTLQSQPITGIPCEVPVPNNVTFNLTYLCVMGSLVSIA